MGDSMVADTRRFRGAAERLRAPERIALLEPERVVSLSIDAVRGSTVLDVGTGTGLFAEAFVRWGWQATGVDVNREYLSMARELVPHVRFEEGAAERLPFENRSFDLTFLGHLLHEAEDPRAALAEALRVTRLRVAVLEWPYREDAAGPPLDHRLRPETINAIAEQAGFCAIERVTLTHTELYRLTC
ncbi:MAG: methyltransferase domain-containing protein [Candidatus Eisenbacteria bacterium]|nr:methyltransferase domain-containing protein [Candidatus Eisenbacteria bacterium]